MFDLSLLLSPSYLILCVSAVLPFIGTALRENYREIGLSECAVFVLQILLFGYLSNRERQAVLCLVVQYYSLHDVLAFILNFYGIICRSR